MQTPRLITIGFSHYCEKARWALDRAGIPYHEERHPPALHYRALKGLGAGNQVPVLVFPSERLRSRASRSESQLSQPKDEAIHWIHSLFRLRKHAGGALGDSTAILRWVDARTPADRALYPADIADEVAALEDGFDEVLGPHIRRVVYFYGLQVKPVMVWTATQGVGRLDKLLMPLLMPFADRFFGSKLGLSPEQIERSKAKVEATLVDVDNRIKDGRRFLVGDRFTAADLTFASLVAPALLPTNYGAPLPTRDQLPAGYGAWMDDLAARHPAVAFARRLYAEAR